MDRGILLHGGPGTGKTMFAQAFARSCRLPFVFGSVSKWQSAGHLGDTLAAMKETFDFARSHQPSIVFLDELDSIGDRTKFRGNHVEYHTQIVNFLLECIDGAAGRQKIVVMGATNFPDAIDRALLRSGRIERHVRLKLPGPDGRANILAYHLGIDVNAALKGVAADLVNWTAADLEMLAREAKRLARVIKRTVSVPDVVAALPPLHELSHAAARRISIHEAGHAVVAHALSPRQRIELSMRKSFRVFDTNVIAHGATRYEDDGNDIVTRQSLEDRICRSFGGAAAEEALLGGRSIGFAGSRGSDLEFATRIAVRMVCSYGMGKDLIFLNDDGWSSTADVSKLPLGLRNEIADILRTQYERALSLVFENREKLDALAQVLFDREHLAHGDVAAVLASDDGKV